MTSENLSTRVLAVEPEPPLLRFERDVTSQWGEDGVIQHALEVISTRDRWCVEFGACDGKTNSNVYSLIDRDGYSAVLIEPQPKRFETLQRMYAGRTDVLTLEEFVDFEGEKRLDRILAETPIPRDFDVLSIDIDGNDYHVWEAVRDYKPKIVVVEFNPTIPNEIVFVQSRDRRVNQASSLAAFHCLARAKGYRLIHATYHNGIFVDEAYFPLFDIADDSPAALRADLSGVTWLFDTFDGQIHLVGKRRLMFHGVPLTPRKFQVLPRRLRAFPPAYSLGQILGWLVWVGVRDPRWTLNLIAERLQRVEWPWARASRRNTSR